MPSLASPVSQLDARARQIAGSEVEGEGRQARRKFAGGGGGIARFTAGSNLPHKQPRAAMRTRRTILETAQRLTLLGGRLLPAEPPLTGGRRRDATASRRLTAGAARRDVGNQRTTTSKSETSVTVKPHPGPSFDCEPSQTHSLEGGPDDLLSRPQPVEARHLARQAKRETSKVTEQVDLDTPARTGVYSYLAQSGRADVHRKAEGREEDRRNQQLTVRRPVERRHPIEELRPGVRFVNRGATRDRVGKQGRGERCGRDGLQERRQSD